MKREMREAGRERDDVNGLELEEEAIGGAVREGGVERRARGNEGEESDRRDVRAAVLHYMSEIGAIPAELEFEVAIVLGRVVEGKGPSLQPVGEGLVTPSIEQHEIVVIIGPV